MLIIKLLRIFIRLFQPFMQAFRPLKHRGGLLVEESRRNFQEKEWNMMVASSVMVRYVPSVMVRYVPSVILSSSKDGSAGFPVLVPLARNFQHHDRY